MYDRPDNLFVPIHPTRLADVVSICTALLLPGDRTGLAFTSAARLAGAMGVGQVWTTMPEMALRAALAPIGISRIQVDADFVGPAVATLKPDSRRVVRTDSDQRVASAVVAARGSAWARTPAVA